MSGKPGIDLNTLSPSASAYGDYGIHDPVNAWPDAASDVVVNVNYLGDNLMQTGFDAAAPATRWTRSKTGDTWGTWARVTTTAEAGGGGIPEAPMDGQQYVRQNGLWVPIIGFPEAPSDGNQYARQDGGWVEVVHDWQSEYLFNDTLVEPPGSGQIRFNALDQTTATRIWVSGFNSAGNDTLEYLGDVNEQSGLSIQDKDNSANNQTYNVTGAGVLKANYYEFPVVWVRGGLPLLAQRVMLTIGAHAPPPPQR